MITQFYIIGRKEGKFLIKCYVSTWYVLQNEIVRSPRYGPWWNQQSGRAESQE
jgi:hypothetical protein